MNYNRKLIHKEHPEFLKQAVNFAGASEYLGETPSLTTKKSSKQLALVNGALVLVGFHKDKTAAVSLPSGFITITPDAVLMQVGTAVRSMCEHLGSPKDKLVFLVAGMTKGRESLREKMLATIKLALAGRGIELPEENISRKGSVANAIVVDPVKQEMHVFHTKH